MAYSPHIRGGGLIYPLFVDRLGHSLQFCQLEFHKEAKFDGFMAHSRVFREGVDDIYLVLDLFFFTFFAVLPHRIWFMSHSRVFRGRGVVFWTFLMVLSPRI